MSEKKSLVEETLIQMRNLEKRLNENAEGILASSMREEISELVKESLNEAGEDDIEEPAFTDEVPDMSDDNAMPMPDEGGMDEPEGDEEVPEPDPSMDLGDDMVDLTNASDEEVLKVFKAMNDGDGIVITKEEGKIHLKDDGTGTEYLISMNEQVEDVFGDDEDMEDDAFMDDELSSNDEEDMDTLSADDDDAFDAKLKGKDLGHDFDDFSKRRGLDTDDMGGENEGSGFQVDPNVDYESEYPESDWRHYIPDMLAFKAEYEGGETGSDEFDDSEFGGDSGDGEFDGMEESEMTEQNAGGQDIDTILDNLFDGNGDEDPIYEIEFEDEELTEEDEAPESVGGEMGEATKPKMFTGKNPEAKKGGSKKEALPKMDIKTNKGKAFGTTPKKGKVTKTSGNQAKKVETKEAARTLATGSKFRKGGLPKPRTAPRHLPFNESAEIKALKMKNEEYRKALNIFRKKMDEVAVFNSNLAYATRLFTEHTTSKSEKINIIKRFDGVTTLKDSKTLYGIIREELSAKTSAPINESIEQKFDVEKASGSATSLIESKTYENPQFQRMKDLMNKINNIKPQ